MPHGRAPLLTRLRATLRARSADRGVTPDDMESFRVAIGAVLTRLSPVAPTRFPADVEFRVFSQFGDDGIIQHLVSRLELSWQQRTFIEFGVEDYSESNTRFLLVKDNWRGLVMDGSQEHMAHVRAQDFYWRHDLTAVAAFIDRDNINSLIVDSGFGGEIGLLSIDIDGNDYWVWEAIEVVDPAIVIVEYNSVFGPSRAVTIPYDPVFRRFDAHSSGLYWGASIAALAHLAERKGYVFVGCNGAGNNAYFVRADIASQFPNPSPADGYVESRFREARAADGTLSFVGGKDRLGLIRDLPLVDIESRETIRVEDLLAR